MLCNDLRDFIFLLYVSFYTLIKIRIWIRKPVCPIQQQEKYKYLAGIESWMLKRNFS